MDLQYQMTDTMEPSSRLVVAAYSVIPFCDDEYMSSLAVPSLDVAAMSPAEAEQFVRGLDRERRIIEARIATFVHQVAVTGLFAADKHRTPKAWGKAACNWSGAEAGRFVKAGAMLATFDSAADMAARGDMGVAQMHALAGLVANPRVKEHLADGEELLVSQAAELDYDDYACLLANWDTTWRDPKGHWHHYHPDGTEIGWRSGITTAADRIFAMPAVS